MTSSNRMPMVPISCRCPAVGLFVALFVLLVASARGAAVVDGSTPSAIAEPRFGQDDNSDRSVSCSPKDPTCLGLRQVAAEVAATESSALGDAPTTNAALSTNGEAAIPLPQDSIPQPSHSRPENNPAGDDDDDDDDDDDSPSPASSPIDCGHEGVAHVLSDGGVTCHDAAAVVAPLSDVTDGQYYDVTPPRVAVPSVEDDEDEDDNGALRPLESMPSETSPAVAGTASGIPEEGGQFGDDGRADNPVTALPQPVENEYRYVDEEHEYPDAGGSDEDVGDYYDVRDDYVQQRPVSYAQNETSAADRPDVADGSRYSMNGDDRNDGVWNGIVDDTTLYGENFWKQTTTDLSAAEADEIGTDKGPAMAVGRPAVGAQRWFDGQGEFSAFVVYTWLAVASASLVIVIILVRYRHEV